VVVAPSQPVAGVVRDATTREPVAGVRVAGYGEGRQAAWWAHPVEAVTDAQGRYRLDGLGKVAKRVLVFDPPAGSPHLYRFAEVTGAGGFEPLALDVELVRGVVVSGRLTDRVTGRPARGRVFYESLRVNDEYARTPGYAFPRDDPHAPHLARSVDGYTDVEGRYRVTVLPGPGVLFVQASDGGTASDRYVHPKVAAADRDPKLFTMEFGGYFRTYGRGGFFPMESLHAYGVIRPAAGERGLTADFALQPGLTRAGRFLDTDGRPLAGVLALGLTPMGGQEGPLPAAEFTATGLDPEQPRRLVVRHPERRLAAVTTLRGDEPEPLVVQLQPAATLTGRAVTAEVEPLVGARATWSSEDPTLNYLTGNKEPPARTDAAGRFRIECIPVGLTVRLVLHARGSDQVWHSVKDLSLRPGEVKDLGDLRPAK